MDAGGFDGSPSRWEWYSTSQRVCSGTPRLWMVDGMRVVVMVMSTRQADASHALTRESPRSAVDRPLPCLPSMWERALDS